MADMIEGLTVSSTEPARLRALGDVSSTEPEKYGADFLWEAQGQTWGVQRKEISDFISSLHDGRLSMELQQMASLDHPLMIIEGQPKWTTEGILYGDWATTFTRTQYNSLKLTIGMQFNVNVHEVPSMTGTVEMIESFVAWSLKTDHDSLLRRPKQKSEWGSASNQDFRIWFLQGVPGVGPKMAKAIDNALGGSPFTLRVEKEDLVAIDGVGEKTADAIIRTVTTRKKRRRIQ